MEYFQEVKFSLMRDEQDIVDLVGLLISVLTCSSMGNNISLKKNE